MAARRTPQFSKRYSAVGTYQKVYKIPENQGFRVTRKYIFQLGGIAPFKGYAVFSWCAWRRTFLKGASPKSAR